MDASLKANIYSDVLRKIVAGHFAAGDHLGEEELALTYHVSRTPIREILFLLQKDGLIERNRHRGARVVSFGPEDVEQIYEIRRALECLAVRKAVQGLNLDELLRIEQRLVLANRRVSPSWKEDQADIDLELHRLIMFYSGNPRLAAYLENISLLIHSLRLLGYSNEHYALQTGEEHLAIVQALLRRDGTLAERLLSAHIDASKRHVLESFLSERKAPRVSAKVSDSKHANRRRSKNH